MNSRHNSPVMRIARIAMLSALGIVGRIAMTGFPNVQPVTALLILSAIFWNPLEALTADVVVVVVTNFVIGMGIWSVSVWQMVSWGVIAVLSWLIFRLTNLYQKKTIANVLIPIWGFLAGFGYGAVVSIFSYSMFANRGYVAYWIIGLPFDLYHAIGNFIFCAALLPVFNKLKIEN